MTNTTNLANGIKRDQTGSNRFAKVSNQTNSTSKQKMFAKKCFSKSNQKGGALSL